MKSTLEPGTHAAKLTHTKFTPRVGTHIQKFLRIANPLNPKVAKNLNPFVRFPFCVFPVDLFLLFLQFCVLTWNRYSIIPSAIRLIVATEQSNKRSNGQTLHLKLLEPCCDSTCTDLPFCNNVSSPPFQLSTYPSQSRNTTTSSWEAAKRTKNPSQVLKQINLFLYQATIRNKKSLHPQAELPQNQDFSPASVQNNHPLRTSHPQPFNPLEE